MIDTMTTEQAAEELGVSVRTIWTLRATGRLEWRYRDRQVAINAHDVHALKERREHATP